MTLEEYEDNYRMKWEKQTKEDKKNNAALRLNQKPAKHAGQSKESGARGGRALKVRPYVTVR